MITIKRISHNINPLINYLIYNGVPYEFEYLAVNLNEPYFIADMEFIMQDTNETILFTDVKCQMRMLENL